jgi:hypothetical protein
MELKQIELLIDKYLEGETSILEEQQLKSYFSSPDVAQHLEHFKPIFGYFSAAKQQQSAQAQKLPVQERQPIQWVAVAASVAIMLGIGSVAYLNDDSKPSELGTYNDPERALKETQKALNLLSTHVNTGVESVQYIEEYDAAKERIFKHY